VSWPATNPSSVPGLRRASLRRLRTIRPQSRPALAFWAEGSLAGVCVAVGRHDRGGNSTAVADRHPVAASPGSNLRIAGRARRPSSGLLLRPLRLRHRCRRSRAGLSPRRGPSPCGAWLHSGLASVLGIAGNLLGGAFLVSSGNGQRDAVQRSENSNRVFEGFAGINGELHFSRLSTCSRQWATGPAEARKERNSLCVREQRPVNIAHS
jgi:hypothetical protein